MIKALFFDIDGTLVSFQTHEVPVSTIEALAAAKAKGMKIFISTGRPKVIINNLSSLQEQELIDGYITMNGAYCFVGEQVIYKHPIPTDEVKTLTGFCARHNIPCIVVSEHGICACQPGQQVKEIFVEYLKVTAPIPTVSVEEAVGKQDIFQLTPFFTVEEEEKIRPLVPHCEMGRWHPSFVDVTAQGTTKQRGIDAICRHFGLKTEETMAFGDGGNDISMLRHAGIGVAMGNAREEVKAVADYVTASVDEEGVAQALKHFGIIAR